MLDSPAKQKQLKIIGDPENSDSCRISGNRMVYFKREREEDVYGGAFLSAPKGARPKGEKKIDDF